MPGDAITGDQSGATATVRYVAVDSGDWATSTRPACSSSTMSSGPLGDETISVTHRKWHIAHLCATPAATAFPPGGRYEFDIFNFYATDQLRARLRRQRRRQGVRVRRQTASPSSPPAGTTTRRSWSRAQEPPVPRLPVRELQQLDRRQPRDFSGVLGAAELGMGHEITNLIPNTAAVMLIFTDQTMSPR
jgi:hypothetical protein